jgi:AcrR family transcriptional regulator
MFDPKQEGTLAGTHAGKPGLPRGRSRLPAPAVQASQRERLLRAAVATIAEKGYPAVTVADIVRRAKVSRAAFYLHFRSREDCFLAASRRGWQLLSGHVIQATRVVPDDAPDEDVLRAACRAFLGFLADEPAFARVFYIDMPAAGPLAVERLRAAGSRFAELNARWHRRARIRHPDWPAVPDEAYQALAGATAELVRSWVGADKTEALRELEDTIVDLHLAVLAARPWPAPASSADALRQGAAAAFRSMRVSAGSASRPQTSVGIPPAARDHLAPNSWAIQPTSGPPIGVEPSQARAHSAMTRPRIAGSAAS